MTKCPICSRKHTLQEVYDKWDDMLDNSLCEPHKKELDMMAVDDPLRRGTVYVSLSPKSRELIEGKKGD